MSRGKKMCSKGICTLCILVLITREIQTYGKQQNNSCVSPQYLELGGNGTINCTFQEDLFRLLWYDAEDYNANRPILQYQYQPPGITRVEHASREYNIYPNGSLSINKVSLQHNRTFTVAYFPTAHDVAIPIHVRVIVTHDTLVKCPSPQFGDIGEVGYIRCNMNVYFSNISWYKDDVEGALVGYDRQTSKDLSGSLGNNNVGYNLLIDGSLLILEVESEKSKGRYKLELISDEIGKLSQLVEFIVRGETSNTTAVPLTNAIITRTPNIHENRSLKTKHHGPIHTAMLIFILLTFLVVTGIFGAVLSIYRKILRRFSNSRNLARTL